MSGHGKRNRCKFCGKFFFLKSALETHEVTKHKNKEKSTEEFTSISKPKEEDEVESELVIVEQAAATFEVDENVPLQKEFKKDTNPFTCHICGKEYNLETTLKTHLIGHNAPELHSPTINHFEGHVIKQKKKKRVLCSICLNKFSSKKLYKSHLIRCRKPSQPSDSENEEVERVEEEAVEEMETDDLDSQEIGNIKEKKSRSKRAVKIPKPEPVTAPNFICKVCDKECSSKGNLREHMTVHEDLMCVICDKKCGSIEHLKSHVKHVHSKKKTVLCSFCGKSMLKSAYRVHLRIHYGEKPFQCGECGKAFTQKSHLLRHEKCHIECKFNCQECGRGFHTEADLDVHILVGHAENFSLDNVSKNMREKLDESGLSISELRREHTPYKCKACNKMFHKWQALLKHEKESHPKLRFKCQVCGEEFLYSVQLRRHYYSHDTKEELGELDEKTRALIKKNRLLYRKCTLCEKYVYKYHMTTHMRIHTGEKPYGCSICGKKFRLKRGLEVHQRVHTGEKPFQCDICNKTFAQYGHLRTHALLHTKEKPYQCPTCDKCFATPDYLYTHQKIHTKDINAPPKRRYPCEHCGKRFRNTDNLGAHEKICEYKITVPFNEDFTDSDVDEAVEEEYNDNTVEDTNPSIHCVTEIHDPGFDGPIILKIEGDYKKDD